MDARSRYRSQKAARFVDFLVARFRAAAEEVNALIETINDEGRLKELVTFAAVCPDLEAFRKANFSHRRLTRRRAMSCLSSCGVVGP